MPGRGRDGVQQNGAFAQDVSRGAEAREPETRVRRVDEVDELSPVEIGIQRDREQPVAIRCKDVAKRCRGRGQKPPVADNTHATRAFSDEDAAVSRKGEIGRLFEAIRGSGHAEPESVHRRDDHLAWLERRSPHGRRLPDEDDVQWRRAGAFEPGVVLDEGRERQRVQTW